MTVTHSLYKKKPALTKQRPAEPLAGDWQKPLPKKTIATLTQSHPEQVWSTWKSYLDSRKKISGLSQLFPYSQSPIAWSLNITLERDETKSFIAHLQNRPNAAKNAASTQNLILKWLETPTDTFHSSDALQAVACAWSLANLSQSIDRDVWWQLKDHLIAIAADALQLDADNQPLAANLLGGELPLVLSYFFPELKSTTDLSGLAIEFLSESLIETLDGEGMLKASHLSLLGPLFGTWTRCRSIMEQRAKLSWDDDAEQQYRWMVTQAIRMTRPHGGFIFGSLDALRSDRDLLEAAIDLVGNKADRLASETILSTGDEQSHKPIRIESSYQSEWAAMAVLRTKWSKKSRQLCTTYENDENRIELSHGRRILLAGELGFQLELDGTALDGSSQYDWEQVAWESDRDVDYLEVEREVSPHARLQRSFLLSRNDQFLLIADAVIGEENSALTHTLQIPLGDKITADNQHDSWEMSLKAPQTLSRVLPLGLPEWKSGSRRGSFNVQRRTLLLQQMGVSRLFVPLFFDLSPKRAKKKLTWRSLAVGEERINVGADVAVGYRVQIGNEQWLIYRSLVDPKPRTLLGQNLLCEYHVSRFLPNGDVEPLIEVQQDHD